MPVKRKRKVDPQEIGASYVFNLQDSCNWSGELAYSSGHKAIASLTGEEPSSIPTISIICKIHSTTSKKINTGTESKILIYIDDNAKNKRGLGIIHHNKGVPEFVMWLPWEIANHVHMILISRQAQMMELSGTELYRRSGKLLGLHIERVFTDAN